MIVNIKIKLDTLIGLWDWNDIQDVMMNLMITSADDKAVFTLDGFYDEVDWLNSSVILNADEVLKHEDKLKKLNRIQDGGDRFIFYTSDNDNLKLYGDTLVISFNIDYVEPLECPMCQGANLEFTKLPNTSLDEGGIWICPVCPFVGFEYCLDEDVKAVYDYLVKE
ncbi:MAG: hypothetical protein ACOCRO_08450 [Halanaerobiales bacterium]